MTTTCNELPQVDFEEGNTTMKVPICTQSNLNMDFE